VSRGEGNQPEEIEMLGGILTGEMNRTDWLGTSVPADFYAAKGIVDSLFEKLGLADNISYSQTEGYEEMHPGRTADIHLGGEKIGSAREFDAQYAEYNDLIWTAVVEVNVDRLLDEKYGITVHEQLPKYLARPHEVTLIVEQSMTADELIQLV